jgi:hypothetical protein
MKRKMNQKLVAISGILIFLLFFTGMTPRDNSQSAGTHPAEKSVTNIYSIYNSFEEMLDAKDSKYFEPVRISPAGSKDNPIYHGFFFYNCSQKELLQFDPSGRYMLGMRIFIEGRKVLPADRGETGIFDLQQNNKWIKIGETTAWNWQQGCRLQWIPGSSEEIIWNDRSSDGKSLISKIYNTRTKKTRILPFTIYTVSPDGKTILSVNFERIKHGGCDYVGVEDPFKNQWAPDKTGIWKMDINTGKVQMILSVKQMAGIMYPGKLPSDTVGGTLYFFREGFNPSGNRFIAFVKDARETSTGAIKTRTEGFSMNLEGKEIKYLYKEPSHHFWLNDEEIIDNGNHSLSEGKAPVRGYFRFRDDGTGKAKEKYFDAPNGHITIHKNGEWILTDTYSIHGYTYLYMYHIPTKKFVPLAKLAFKLAGKLFGTDPGIFRVDLHPRFSPDGRTISFDSTHEGLGRQIYLMDINQIVNNPPSAK